MTGLLRNTRADLFVVERDGHWAAALRQALGETPWLGGDSRARPQTRPSTLLELTRITEMRSLDDLWPLLGDHPRALIAAELTAINAEQLVSALIRLEREFPAAGMFAMAERGLEAYSGVVREAGALWAVDSPRRLADVSQLVARRLNQRAYAPRSPNVEGIYNNLPWADVLNP